jgi:hypothetical protein
MDQLWEIEADAIMNKTKCSAEMVRTVVILRWMYLKGDLRPLADAILKRHEIDGEAVLNALALMILEDDAVPASLKDLTPYRLESKRRSGKPGRPREPGKAARGFKLHERYVALKEELGPGKSNDAFDLVAKQRGVSDSTVRQAHTRYSK